MIAESLPATITPGSSVPAIVTPQPADSDLVEYESPADNSRGKPAELVALQIVEKYTLMLADSAFTPAHLIDPANPRRTQANCFRVALQAHNWGRNPFDVADRSYVTKGKIGYEGKLVASVVNTRAGLKSRLAYEYSGSGDDRTVTVIGHFRNEPTPRTITLSVKQAKTSNEMWTKDPDQKLAYCGALRWARRHCPEVIDGVMTEDDLEIIAERESPPADTRTAEEIKAEADARAEAAKVKQREALAAQRAALAGGKGEAKVEKVEPPAEAAKPVEAPKVEVTYRGGVTPAVEVPVTPPPAEIRKDTPITAETKLEINRLLDALGTTDAELLRMIKSYDLKAAKLGQLKEFDALEIQATLHAQWWAKEPKNATVEAPTKHEGGALSMEAAKVEPAPSSPQASLNTAPNSTTPAQKKRLIELRTQLPGAVWPLEEQKAFLAKHNAAGFVTLSEAVAAELLADLEARAAKLSAA